MFLRIGHIFLVLCMTSNFGLHAGHFNDHIMKQVWVKSSGKWCLFILFYQLVRQLSSFWKFNFTFWVGSGSSVPSVLSAFATLLGSVPTCVALGQAQDLFQFPHRLGIIFSSSPLARIPFTLPECRSLLSSSSCQKDRVPWEWKLPVLLPHNFVWSSLPHRDFPHTRIYTHQITRVLIPDSSGEKYRMLSEF